MISKNSLYDERATTANTHGLIAAGIALAAATAANGPGFELTAIDTSLK